MKKIVSLVLMSLLTISLAACGNGNNNNTNTTPETTPETTPVTDSSEDNNDAIEPEANSDSNANNSSAAGSASGTIVITGSTSVEKILNDMKDEFEALNPDVSIQYTGSGSSAGIKDTINEVNDIGASSRELKDEEKESGVKEVVFAYDGIAVIVNPSNGVENLTIEQLKDIYSGAITNWSEVGGEDKEIFVVSREESSGTRSAFEELISLDETDGLIGGAAVQEGNGPVQAAVSSNENAIGYVSFSYIDDSVKALTVESVEPTAQNAKAGTYELSRPFIMCYFEETATDAAKAFIDFSLTEDAQEIVADHGGIRVD